jgi:hypothetical protein
VRANKEFAHLPALDDVAIATPVFDYDRADLSASCFHLLRLYRIPLEMQAEYQLSQKKTR